MTDLICIGGPVGTCYAQKVQWLRPTAILSVSAGTARNTSSDQYSVYAKYKARDGYAWRALAERAGIALDALGNLGIVGFSAFHGFADAMLNNDEDLRRTSYVHLADACFDMPNPTVSGKKGYVRYAKIAASGGDKLLVATTNGPAGKDLSYSWTYPEGDKVDFHMSSGEQCIHAVWNESTSGIRVTTPPTPPGVPEPTFKKRAGNFIWFHYETMTPNVPHPCSGDYTSHGWHMVVLGPYFMQMYGAPWLAGERPSSWAGKALAMGAGIAAGAYAAKRVLRKAGW